MASCRSVLCLAALAVLSCQADATVTGTPIARVISLLGKLEGQIEREGKKEAAEYDKYACYCKDQADKTLYNIETSREKIAVLTAAIDKLAAEITELASDIADLVKKIEEKKTAIQTAVDDRAAENVLYVKAATDIADAIGAIEDAIKELKGSKDDMKKAKLNLLQDQLLEVLSLSSPTESQLQAVQALVQAPADPAKKHAYVYRSNDIIGTLENLLAEFKQKKKDANMAEKEKLFAFEENKQSLENEKAFAEKDKREKTALKEEKQTDHDAKDGERTAETDDMNSDQAFLKELTADGEDKAKQWDQRSEIRSGELTAISKAMEQLKGGVAGNYGSNSLSFIQLHRARGSAAATVAQVASLVSGEAKRLHSASLSGLALKLNMGGHFDKVVQLIKDLIKKLEDEAAAAADSKTFCDENMAKAVAARDDNKLDMEKQSATIAMKTALKKKLGGEVNKLASQIAELSKSLLEATELRSEEKANNAATVAEATEGKTAVDQAITVLTDFYSVQFLQESKMGAPEGANRDGKTVADTAPKLSYDGDYKGKQDASKGIIGILEVIASDFQKTIDGTGNDETSSQADFEAFETKTGDDKTAKNKLKGEKEDEITAASTAITDAKDSRIDAEKLMTNALEELEEITAQCLTGEGTFAERKKQREEEITSLKGAMKILEDWKAF